MSDDPADDEATVESETPDQGAADGGADADALEGEYDVDADDAAATADDGEDETTPHVELQLYQLSVGVSGQSTDGLDDVSATARELMDYLIDRANELEEEPDNRGLG